MRRRGSSQSCWSRDKGCRFIRVGMFVCKNKGLFASAASANGSIEMDFIIVDDLVPHHGL